MPTYYSKEVFDDVQGLLLTPPSVQPINTSWKMIMAVFRREGILKPKRLIHVRDIYPHPKNRGGMMLNGFNAQANASKVQRVGANRDELHGAVVIEMNPFPSQKQAQIDANLESPSPRAQNGACPWGRGTWWHSAEQHFRSFALVSRT